MTIAHTKRDGRSTGAASREARPCSTQDLHLCCRPISGGDTYYFGRGATACLAVQMRPGDYARVFVGNGKSLEKGEYVLMARDELLRLSDFFKALWQEHGQNLYVAKLTDDPHDEVFVHNLDFTQVE